jgi:hypothetical protein
MTGDLPGGPVTSEEISTLVNKLKRRKAPGPDQITYEHIIFGGPRLHRCIAKLFNGIILQGKIPYAWKKGFIIPLYKVGDKQKTSTNSYRPVALLSCFLKIFESVQNSRTEEYILKNQSFPNKQPQGFEEKLGSITASFNLQETIYHQLEQGSNVLDSSKSSIGRLTRWVN